MSETREPVTIDDLRRIYIRAEMPDGSWDSINCDEASNEQFDTWARSRIAVKGRSQKWSPEQRAELCNFLWQHGGLVMIRKKIGNE